MIGVSGNGIVILVVVMVRLGAIKKSQPVQISLARL